MDLEGTMSRGFLPDLLRYLPSHLVPAVVGLVSIPVITELFPPEDYGNYTLALTTVSILVTISSWLTISIVRFYPACESNHTLGDLRSSVFTSLLVSLSAGCALVGGVLLVTRPLLDPQFLRLMSVGVGLFALSTTFGVLQSFLRARLQAAWYSFFSVWDSVAKLGFGVALVLGLSLGVEGLLWGAVLAFAVTLPLLWKVAIGKQFGPGRASLPLIQDMLKYAMPLVVGNLAAWVLNMSDRYVLKAFRGAGEVGLYSASYAISERSITVLAALFMLAAGPIGVRIWENEGESRARDFLRSVTRHYLLLAVPAVVGLSVLAKPVIEMFTSPEYHSAYRVTPMIALSGFILGLQQRYHPAFLFNKKTRTIMVIVFLSGAVNLALNLVFVPRYGYMAAAATTLIGYVVLLGLVIVSSRKYLTWRFPFATLARSILASAVMAVVVYPVGTGLTSSNLVNLAVAVPSGILVYVVAIAATGELRPDEKRTVLSSLARLGAKMGLRHRDRD